MGLSTSYSVILRGRKLAVTVERLPGGRALVAIEGATPLEVAFLTGSAEAVALVGERVVELWALGHEVTARGEHDPVRVERHEPRLGPARESSARRSANVRAPMPGRIVKVLVEVGAALEPGDGVVVIEAMKMENELFAPAAGVVSRVLVGPGDAVERDALLVEIE